MKLKLYIPVYALTLLVSATLLFSVQPLFSKMILPLLGGTPQVWNTAMLFFQVCLLGGYAYAHGTTRFLSVRVQASLHVVLLAIFTIVLPIAIPEGWSPPVDRDPTLWQLSLMAVAVGGPFFVLAGSAPMLQRWFAQTDHPHADNPYFLYGASNLGSMTSLLAYPFIIEPFLNLGSQSLTWSWGYYALIALVGLCGLLVWSTQKVQTATALSQSTKAKAKAAHEIITWGRRGRWLFLAFVPSSLMLGVTTFITTDIASVPLIWILPLALYVGTFIIVFADKPVISLRASTRGFEIMLIVVMAQLIAFNSLPLHPFILMAVHFCLFFFAALMAHSALVKAKPAAAHLTEFYLIMALGGALGGFFNAIIAPNFFVIPLEYGLVLILATFIRYSDEGVQSFKNWYGDVIDHFKVNRSDAFFTRGSLLIGMIAVAAVFASGIPNHRLYIAVAVIIAAGLLFFIKQRWTFALLCLFLFLVFPPGYQWGYRQFEDILLRDRNFFGVMRVIDTANAERILLHGTTNHGAQALEEKYKLTPLSYYSTQSPIHDAFQVLNAKGGQQDVAVIGLGIGVTACFSKDGRHFNFYEIDKDIANIAENPELFTYLSDCGSPYEIILGDGRLQIQNAEDGHYDMIVIDAFSSDNIPIHLLTAEAIEGYMRAVQEDGFLIFNISNNYLDLEPVLGETAASIGLNAYAHITDGGKIEGTELSYYPAHFLVISKTQKVFDTLAEQGWSQAQKREGVRPWSDQYSNILSIMGNKAAFARMKSQAPAKVTHEKIKMVVDPASNPMNKK